MNEITIPVPHTANEIATWQRAEEDGAAFPDFTIETADEYTAVDAMLTDIVRRKDAYAAMERAATAPLNEVIKTVRGWFSPLRKTLEATETRLKSTMAEYRIAQHAREREARELVATATGAELVQALTEASAAPAAGRATMRLVWRVERVIADLLPDEWWCVDKKKIDAFARAHKGDDLSPPVIPGVVFKIDAQIGARR